MVKILEKIGLAQICREHKGQGKQIRLLARSVLKKTYQGSLLGPLWAIIKPLFTLFILWFAFEIGIRGTSEVHGFPRFVFMLTGYIPWFYMSECITKGSKCLRDNKTFVTKISFPVSNIMTFTNLAALYVHIGLTVLMYIALICMGVSPSLYNLQILIYMPLMFIFFLALSWTTSTFSAFSKDFQNLINSIMTGLFWFSGIFWDTYDVGNIWIKRLLMLNPISFFANGYRKTFLYQQPFCGQYDTFETIVIFAELLFVIVIGAYNYKRLRKTLPDVL